MGSTTVRCASSTWWGKTRLWRWPTRRRTRASLAAAPFLVVQDSYLTDTASYAHVVLPAAVPTEVDGTYTNGECFVQRVRAVTPPAGQSRPDWQIIGDIAATPGGRVGIRGSRRRHARDRRRVRVPTARSPMRLSRQRGLLRLGPRGGRQARASPRLRRARPSDDGSAAAAPLPAYHRIGARAPRHGRAFASLGGTDRAHARSADADEPGRRPGSRSERGRSGEGHRGRASAASSCR